MGQRRWLGIGFLLVIAGSLTVNSTHGAELILYSNISQTCRSARVGVRCDTDSVINREVESGRIDQPA